ncbi:MAG: acyl-CoA dehydrogenase family protein [Anaerolineales bacterium]
MLDFKLSQEQMMWQETVHDFVAREVKPKAKEVDESGQFNWDAVEKMGNIGLLGLNVPEEYGGAGMDTICAAIAIEELGWGCGSTALSIAAHNSLGCMPLVWFGSDSLKKTYLPRVAGGNSKNGVQRKLAALSLTEPGAGSDLKGGITTRAWQENDEWVISGAKMWCTNASISEYILTLARTDPKGGSKSLSLFLVPSHSPGIFISPSEKKMGLKGSPTNAISYDQVRVPLDHLLGQPGDGLKQALQTLDGGRIGIAALSVGLARAAFEEAVQYAKQRKAFGKSIAEQEAIQWMIADAATEIQAARLLVYYAAWVKDSEKPYSKEAAMAKMFASEMAERVCRNAIQIHGGYGYSREYPVERIYRDARLMTIGEGTSEIQRLVIARQVFDTL